MLPKEISTTQQMANIILENYFIEWTNWKCSIIYSLIKRIVKVVKKINPKILINIHVVPWKKVDFGGAIKSIAGQDIEKIAKVVDFISPMCYSHMLKRKPSWINEVVEDIFNQTNQKILPSIQVEKCYLNRDISTNEFREMIREAIKDPLS